MSDHCTSGRLLAICALSLAVLSGASAGVVMDQLDEHTETAVTGAEVARQAREAARIAVLAGELEHYIETDEEAAFLYWEADAWLHPTMLETPRDGGHAIEMKLEALLADLEADGEGR